MSLRQRITDALLPVLKELDGRCCAGDLGFFGGTADIALPLFAKYGVDSSEALVYNIKNGVSADGFPLFSSVRISGGFLELDVDDHALARFAAEVCASPDEAALVPADEFELGKGPGFVRARLLDIYRQKGGEFAVPRDTAARRALWHCLAADSPSSLNRAVKEAENALLRERLLPGDLSGGAALAMAISLYEASRKINL